MITRNDPASPDNGKIPFAFDLVRNKFLLTSLKCFSVGNRFSLTNLKCFLVRENI